MTKIYSVLFAICLMFAGITNAQQLKSSQKNKAVLEQLINKPLNLASIETASPRRPYTASEKCGFSFMMEQAKAAGFNDALYEQKMEELILQRRAALGTGRPAVIYTVPVIFHIAYSGSTEATIGTGANIFKDLVDSQIVQMNRDFADLSGSVYGVSEDMGIRFVPAKVSPTGTLLCEPGIERINWESRAGWLDPTTLPTLNSVLNHYNNVVKPQSIWDPYRYLNIWLGEFSSSGLLGFASFPGNSTLAGLDNLETDLTAGVVLLTSSVGSIYNPGAAFPYDMGRTATHELGHFFGLRHIWGDGTCATDYCADTPPQDDATSGCPGTGALNNCTPSGPKMFENYMDYSDDACLNTFTLNQSERCQTVMANSPRRLQLATSTTGNEPISNRIFIKGFNTVFVTEAGTGTCPRYKEVTVTVGVAVAANGNASVSLSKSGTATDGADYAIVQPSVNYTNGDASDKTFTVRIYDDPSIELDETIILGLNLLSGTGVQVSSACPNTNLFTITIEDDDVIYNINNTAPAVSTLLTENFGTVAASGALPAGWLRGSFLTPAGTNVWTVNAQYGAATGFTAGTNGRVLHVTNGSAATQTAETAPNTYTSTSSSNTAVITRAITTTGYQNVKITFDYACNGEEDVDGIYDFGIMRYSTTAQTSGLIPVTDANGNLVIFKGATGKTSVTVSLPPDTWNIANLWICFNWINDASIGNNPPFIIDNIVVTGENTGVETILNQAVTQINSQGLVTQFISNTNKIIATVTGPNANIGCNTASVQNAGTDRTDIFTNAGSFFRSNKVIKITPAITNTNATYQVTLYYTTAELAVWGSSAPNLIIMKVNDGVDLSSTLTGATTRLLATTFDDQRATKGYASYTGTALGGFSQFMLVSPNALIPVTLLSFDARGKEKNILLNWSTATETNNKGFVIERSLNGVDFEKIGWMDGKLNSNQVTNYSYTDNFVQPNIIYHYRLRQTDLDQREKLSAIRQAKIKSSNIEVSVSPNPAKDQVRIFVSGTSGLSDVKLINTAGQTVKSWKQLNVTAAPATLKLEGLASGIYMLQVITPGSTSINKLIIQ